MGLASAWALRRAGRDVTVLEQFEVGHPYGSSHGASRIFRFAYSETEWVELAQQALPLWRELEQESGTEVLSLTGLLDSSGDSAALRSALDACSAEYEVLDPGEAGRRFGIELEGEVVLELHGGIVRADRALAAFSRGVRIEPGVRVLSLQAGGSGVSLETSNGTIEAALAVVAAGAWATPLAGRRRDRAGDERLAGDGLVLRPSCGGYPAVGHRLELRRQAVTRIRCRPARTCSRSGCTTRACRWSPASVASRIPRSSRPSRSGCGSATLRRIPRPRRRDMPLHEHHNDEFVIERHGSIIGCSACSGHGFKFAPAVGTRVAALA